MRWTDGARPRACDLRRRTLRGFRVAAAGVADGPRSADDRLSRSRGGANVGAVGKRTARPRTRVSLVSRRRAAAGAGRLSGTAGRTARGLLRGPDPGLIRPPELRGRSAA